VALQAGDVAGLALLNLPYAWIGVKRNAAGSVLAFYDQLTGASLEEPLTGPRVWLRAHCNFDTDVAELSYSTDGAKFNAIGGEMKLPFQLKTFQGVRYALFNYNTGGQPGGHADFNDFIVSEPRPRGLTRPIPIGRPIELTDLSSGNVLAVEDGKLQSLAAGGKAAALRVIDRGRGRIALRTADGKYVSVSGQGKSGEVVLKAGSPGEAETFQWVDLQRGDTLLLSLATHRYIVAPSAPGPVSADHAADSPESDGARGD